MGLTMILVRLLQPENACSPMLPTPPPMLMLARFVQPSNAKNPMLVTLSGMMRLVRPRQRSNPWPAAASFGDTRTCNPPQR